MSRPGCCVGGVGVAGPGDKSCTPETCMQLPDGDTCGDCIHVARCWLFGVKPTDTSCDFFPRRFQLDIDKPIPYRLVLP